MTSDDNSRPQKSEADLCRICQDGDSDAGNLITPCRCAGSVKFVHQTCLQKWIKSSDTRHCELCRCQFEMQTKLKPFSKWEKLDMSTSERRKILCSVGFHVIAITCVIWSLWVLIQRTAQEISSRDFHWPFWTKLIVVAIGFIGGLVFMYVQCKVYVQLWRRLKAYNRVIYVQNHPIIPAGSSQNSPCRSLNMAHESEATLNDTRQSVATNDETCVQIANIGCENTRLQSSSPTKIRDYQPISTDEISAKIDRQSQSGSSGTISTHSPSMPQTINTSDALNSAQSKIAYVEISIRSNDTSPQIDCADTTRQPRESTDNGAEQVV